MKMAENVVIIPKWLAEALKPLLRLILDQVVAKIEPVDVREAANGAVTALINTITVLADDEPKNGKQVTEVWLRFVNQDVVKLAGSQFDAAVAKIEDENVRAVLASVKLPLLQTLSNLTDDVQPDGVQIKAAWLSFIRDQKNQATLVDNIVVPLAEKVIKNEQIVQALAVVLKFVLASLKYE